MDLRRTALLAAFVLMGACTKAEDAATRPAGPGATTVAESGSSTVAETTVATAKPVAVQPGVGQLTVTEVEPGTEVTVARSGTWVASAAADAEGTQLFRNLEPGDGYEVTTSDGGRTAGLTVLDPAAAPDPQLYTGQTLPVGYGYLVTRDGTTLAVNVTLPGDIANGPYPTLVEYSGYDPANPTAGSGAGFVRQLAPLMGYAVVQVNVRGTGCSGGSFDAFEAVQAVDGYDVIETVAAQRWAKPTVGMVGLSYPAIMQLHVAATQPPHLAAIAPLSALASLESVVAPGGIPNTGFAKEWATSVGEKAKPFGQGWERSRVRDGDEVCEVNQKLRGHNPSLVDAGRAAELSARSPLTLAPKITVPVFLSAAWQDEQVGDSAASLVFELAKSSPNSRAVLYNGLHADGFSPVVLAAVQEFYDIYVAGDVPATPSRLRSLVPLLTSQIYGQSVDLPPDRFSGVTDPAAARATYEAEPAVRVLFEMGGDPARRGLPIPRYEANFDTWLPPSTPTKLYAASGGRLTAGPSAEVDGGTVFATNPAQASMTTIEDAADLANVLPPWTWLPPTAGQAAVFTTEALGAETVVVGVASFEAFVEVAADTVDLEVTLSEVAVDGAETQVQVGWLRVKRSGASAQLAVVELPPVAHTFRAGSKVRISVDSPGGSRPRWTFEAKDPAGVPVTIRHDAAHGTALTLPTVAGIDAPDEPPACPGLRGQPCRATGP